MTPTQITAEAASPVLRLHAMGGQPWVRDVPRSNRRYGPWLQARYDLLNQVVFNQPGACLYVVLAHDGRVRYVGKSDESFATRWRTRPAVDAHTAQEIPHQLFHSECWRHMEAEFACSPGSSFEVRSITEAALANVIASFDDQFESLAGTDNLVVAVERWVRAHRTTLGLWNAR